MQNSLPVIRNKKFEIGFSIRSDLKDIALPNGATRFVELAGKESILKRFN